MTPTRYRAAVVTAAVAWLMVGLHLPAFHALEHGRTVPTSIVAVTALLTVIAVGATVMLWRDPRGPATRR